MPFIEDDAILSDPTSRNPTPELLPLEELVGRMLEDGARRLRVALPCAVVAVSTDQTVDLQPLLKVRYVGRPPSEMKVLRSCPVLMPQGQNWRLGYPLAVGDLGLALVADRSLDAWLAGEGGIADPADTRAHDLNDAVFLPGLVPDALNSSDIQTDLVLQNGGLTMRLQKDGHLEVQNQAQKELVATLHAAIQCFINALSALQSAQTLTAFGPAPFLATSIQQFAQLQAQAQSILSDLDTFKA